MSKGKEYITLDELTDMMSEVVESHKEHIRQNPDLYPNIILTNRLYGKLSVFCDMFIFLGLGTEEEIEKVMNRKMDEIKEELRRVKLCQV